MQDHEQGKRAETEPLKHRSLLNAERRTKEMKETVQGTVGPLFHPSQRLPTDGGKTGEPGETPLSRRSPHPESLSQTNPLIPFLAL